DGVGADGEAAADRAAIERGGGGRGVLHRARDVGTAADDRQRDVVAGRGEAGERLGDTDAASDGDVATTGLQAQAVRRRPAFHFSAGGADGDRAVIGRVVGRDRNIGAKNERAGDGDGVARGVGGLDVAVQRGRCGLNVDGVDLV